MSVGSAGLYDTVGRAWGPPAAQSLGAGGCLLGKTPMELFGFGSDPG